jgi:probable F420-dependent oxidoreductase
METGIFTAVTDESIGPVELARAVEERGFESLFVAEHTHIPVRVDTPYPAGGVIPRDYYRVYDPFVTLAQAAAVTTRLRLGTAVTLLVQRDPIVTAKEVATLDAASGGRLELGFGVGWLREEMRNHGTDPRTRVALQRERILAMKEIWTREKAEFHGCFVDFDPIYSWPKPAQRPHPPLWLGGWGPTTHERILDHADGWLAPTGIPIDELGRGIEQLEELARRNDRPPVPVIATVFEPGPGELARLAELGVHRTLIGVDVLRPDNALRMLDQAAQQLSPNLADS